MVMMRVVLLLLLPTASNCLGPLSLFGSSYLYRQFRYPGSYLAGRANRRDYARQYGRWGENLIAQLGRGHIPHNRKRGRIHRGRTQSGGIHSGGIQSGGIQSGMIQSGRIQSGRIHGGGIQNGMIQSGGIQSGRIQSGEIKSGKILSGGIQSNKIHKKSGYRTPRHIYTDSGYRNSNVMIQSDGYRDYDTPRYRYRDDSMRLHDGYRILNTVYIQ